jgi:hypothetical protein
MSAGRRPLALTDGQRLGWISEQVKVWRTYVEQPQSVLDGSSLAVDDAIFSVLPPSHLVWHGISHAVDHLDMFMVGLTEGKKSHPIAPSTLARSGILGSAHALWLLDGPDRAERQRRALKIAHEEFYRDRQMLRDIADISRDDPGTELIPDISVVQQQIDLRTEWIGRAIAAGATLGMGDRQVTAQLDETSIIDAVAKRYAVVTRDSHELVKAYRLLWRTYSGTAHGLRWSAMARAKIVKNEQGRGGNGWLTNDLADLGMAACAVALFTLRAVNLYEIRRKPHAM